MHAAYAVTITTRIVVCAHSDTDAEVIAERYAERLTPWEHWEATDARRVTESALPQGWKPERMTVGPVSVSIEELAAQAGAQ